MQLVKIIKKNPDVQYVFADWEMKNVYKPFKQLENFTVDSNDNIVKLLTDIKDNVIYLSRAKLPLEFKQINKSYKKHLSIISFKPDALKKFHSSKRTPLEKSEDIELLRALEIGLKIKTLPLRGDSFSIDILDDYKKNNLA